MFDHARLLAIEAGVHRIESAIGHLGVDLAQLPKLHPLLEALMESIDSLRAQVAQANTVMDSAQQLIAGFKAQLDAAIAAAKAGDDHAALDQLAADLSTHSTALANAVRANTVADPAGSQDKGPAPVANTDLASTASTGTATNTGADAGTGSNAGTAETSTGAAAAAADSGSASTEPGTGAVGAA